MTPEPNTVSLAAQYATPLNTAYPWRTFACKVYFDRLGRVERVVKQMGSGHPERDAQCLSYAKSLSITLPRLKTKMSGQVWRNIRIAPDAVLTPTPLAQPHTL